MLLLSSNNDDGELKPLTGSVCSRLLQYLYENHFATIDVLTNALLALPLPTLSTKQAGVRFDYNSDTDSLYIELNPERERKPGGTQAVVGWGEHEIVIDIDGDGTPIGIDIDSFASRLVDLTRLEAEGPVFGLVRPDSTERRVS